MTFSGFVLYIDEMGNDHKITMKGISLAEYKKIYEGIDQDYLVSFWLRKDVGEE